MPWTMEQYTSLQSALATGSKRVKYADKEVEYRSLSEMMALLDAMAEELGITTATSNAGRRVARFNNGLYPSSENCNG